MNHAFIQFVGRRCLMALGVISALGWTSAWAQDAAFPNGPITLLVPNPPGGASDINARILAEPWSLVLKQPVVVQHKPGMGGAKIGRAHV